jgi:hypothetical protein
MKNPKEKAIELVEKYKELEITTLGCGDGNPCIIKNTMIYNSAKQCALIAVDEVLNNEYGGLNYASDIAYWQQVKTEIEKLIK